MLGPSGIVSVPLHIEKLPWKDMLKMYRPLKSKHTKKLAAPVRDQI